MHFDVRVVISAFEICVRLFIESFTHSWFIGITNALEGRNGDSEVELNPFSLMKELPLIVPESLLGLIGKWILAVLFVIASLFKLLLMCVKLPIVSAIALVILLGSLLVAVRLRPENEVQT